MVSTLESSKGLAEKNAYILPSLVDFQSKKLRLFFLPDGNERAKRQSSLGYGDGGKNVVKVIQSLAERGDVEEVVFAILSHENIVGRGEAFFHELYLAFMGLGIAIDRKGDLVKSGVRLEIAGSLNLLKRTNQSTRLLADMIEAVVNRTHLGKEPKLIVKFGIDYEVDTLIKEGTDIVFRTGMGSPNTFRSSGLNISNNMLCIGSDVLWPKLDPNFVSDQIDRVKKGGHRFLENGHSTMVAARIIEKIKPIHGCNIDMPIDTDYNSMIRAIELLVDQNRELLQYLGVLVVDRTGNIRRIGKSNVDFNISLFEAAENNPGIFRRSYDFMVAPGQTGSDFILPANPFIDYATVFGCKDTPEDIIGTVILAIDNLKVNPPLFGTQRPYSINETSNGFDEFNFYESLADV
ncbi:hypothetical protein IT412_02710, partial [Candidatus Peregrinibacteria bacterium]|nr:hypothetical protein [Candidatus Peregrinibacteria bacterium]